MKFIRDLFEKTEPYVQHGAKYHWLHSVHDGFFTLFFVQKSTSKTGVHIHDYIDLKRTMALVVLSLVPVILFGMYNTGFQHYKAIGELSGTGFFAVFFYGFLKVVPVIVVSYVTGLGIEFVFAQIRGHDIQEGFLVSGILIPLVMPVETPLWMIAIATAFAVIIGKEVFGGTGMNIWNPALLARAFLFFAYPTQMSGNAVWVSLRNADQAADGFTGATPLAIAAEGNIHIDTADAFFGFIPGSVGETSTLAILLGAAILVITGIGSWKIIVSTVAGGLIMGLLLNIFAVNSYMELPFWKHLILGGFAFGAVFMATDPVSATQTEKGKWIYGFLIGFLAILFRVLNPAYPEGMMLSILLMNTFAPLIDHYILRNHIKNRMKQANASSYAKNTNHE